LCCEVERRVSIVHAFSMTRAKETPMSDVQNDEDHTIYRVVVNHEEQYSIWPAHRDTPLGWRDAGKTGTKEECLAYVNEVWTDMRPLSLRRAMEGQTS
jgi:MbtH protein